MNFNLEKILGLKKIAVGAVLAVLSTTSFANSFDGAFVQGLVGYQKNKMDVSGLTQSLNKEYSEKNSSGQFAFGYSKAFGQFNLAGGAFINAGPKDAGEISGNGAALKGYLENMWGVSIEPGFNIGKSALAYAKIGYSRSEAGVDALLNGRRVDGVKKNVNGLLFGVGGKFKISDMTYAVAEIQQVNFRRANFDDGVGIKASSFGAYVGLGMKF